VPADTSGDLVLYEVNAGIAVLTLNRPERLNAWIPELGNRYFDLLFRAGQDPQVRAIIVTGAGKGFCAGADIAWLDTGGEGAPDAEQRTQRHRPHDTLSIPKPVIAAINGACIGLGFVLALMCDIRFAAAGAKFGTAFARRGLVAEAGSSWVLPRIVGQAAAMDVLLSGRIFLAEEALSMGLVSRISAPGDLLNETREYAADLVRNCSPASMAAIKRQVYRDSRADLATAIRESAALTSEALAGSDFKEGIDSFIEKRAPSFSPLAREEIADPFAS
jgi:enoyl-CoA hydratase/carnithine racemase